MVGDSTSQWGTLEKWSPTLFLIAGVLLVVYAALTGIVAVTDTASQTVEDVAGPAGFVFGFVGLLGLYPTIADRSPKLARAGALSAALGAVGFSTITLQGLARLAGVEPTAWLGIFVLVAAIGMIPGFLAFGAATLRTDVHSRALGFLLLAPATIFAVMVSQAFSSLSGDCSRRPRWHGRPSPSAGDRPWSISPSGSYSEPGASRPVVLSQRPTQLRDPRSAVMK